MSFAEQLYNANTYIEIYMQVTQNQACLTHDKTKTLTWGLDTDLIEKSHHHNTPDILLVLFREVKFHSYKIEKTTYTYLGIAPNYS